VILTDSSFTKIGNLFTYCPWIVVGDERRQITTFSSCISDEVVEIEVSREDRQFISRLDHECAPAFYGSEAYDEVKFVKEMFKKFPGLSAHRHKTILWITK